MFSWLLGVNVGPAQRQFTEKPHPAETCRGLLETSRKLLETLGNDWKQLELAGKLLEMEANPLHFQETAGKCCAGLFSVGFRGLPAWRVFSVNGLWDGPTLVAKGKETTPL